MTQRKTRTMWPFSGTLLQWHLSVLKWVCIAYCSSSKSSSLVSWTPSPTQIVCFLVLFSLRLSLKLIKGNLLIYLLTQSLTWTTARRRAITLIMQQWRRTKWPAILCGPVRSSWRSFAVLRRSFAVLCGLFWSPLRSYAVLCGPLWYLVLPCTMDSDSGYEECMWNMWLCNVWSISVAAITVMSVTLHVYMLVGCCL